MTTNRKYRHILLHAFSGGNKQTWNETINVPFTPSRVYVNQITYNSDFPGESSVGFLYTSLPLSNQSKNILCSFIDNNGISSLNNPFQLSGQPINGSYNFYATTIDFPWAGEGDLYIDLVFEE